MKKLIFVLSLFSMSSVYGAIPSGIQGQVTLKVDASHVQINIGHQLRPGEEVAIYKQSCQGPKVQLCHKDLVGTGVVSKVLNEKTSEIQVDPSLAIQDGDLIEKK